MTSNEAIKILYDNLKPVQQQMAQDYYSSPHLKQVIHCSRRLGKTYLLCTVATITAIHKPNALIRYASVTQKAVRQMIFPIMREIMAMVAPKYRGVWNGQDGCYKFPNGSLIYVAGVNAGHEDDLRGTRSDLVIVDEAAFVDRLDYLWSSVLMGQLISPSGEVHGRGLIASSSPLSPAHEFGAMIMESKKDGNYSSYDIHQAGYSEASIALFAKEAGGVNTTTWRREYLNALIVDDVLSVIPEWNNKYIQELPTTKWDKFYHRYEAMDLGVRDKTAVLFAKYIFDKAQLYVERDWTISGQDTTTKNIAENIRRIESELGYKKVEHRIADNNSLITLNDLNNGFGLYFGPTSKDSLAAMVNEVRLWVQDGRLIIHPCCTELISCLQYGVYQDNKRKEFGRSKALGHYDALAALVYLIRNVDQVTNPIVTTDGLDRDRHFIPNEVNNDSEILKIFNVR